MEIDDELFAEFSQTLARLKAFMDEFEEFVPMLRAYLDPDQSGPRGFFMRRRLAETNGRTHV